MLLTNQKAIRIAFSALQIRIALILSFVYKPLGNESTSDTGAYTV